MKQCGRWMILFAAMWCASAWSQSQFTVAAFGGDLRTSSGEWIVLIDDGLTFEIERDQFVHSGSLGGIALKYRPLSRVSFELAATSAASATVEERWPGFPELEMGPPPPPDVPVRRDTSIRALLAGVALYQPVAERVELFVKAGASHTRDTTSATPLIGTPVVHERRRTRTVPWLGVGTQYTAASGLTLTAEYGAGSDDFSLWRVGVGWTWSSR